MDKRIEIKSLTEALFDKLGEEQCQLKEAIELKKYFTQRVEEGSIRSKTTYTKYKNFLDKWKIE